MIKAGTRKNATPIRTSAQKISWKDLCLCSNILRFSNLFRLVDTPDGLPFYIKQNPNPAAQDWGPVGEVVVCLLWREVLVIAQVVHVLEHRRRRWQVLWLQE